MYLSGRGIAVNIESFSPSVCLSFLSPFPSLCLSLAVCGSVHLSIYLSLYPISFHPDLLQCYLYRLFSYYFYEIKYSYVYMYVCIQTYLYNVVSIAQPKARALCRRCQYDSSNRWNFSLVLKVDRACILHILDRMEIHRSGPPHEKVQSPRVGVLSILQTTRSREEDDRSFDFLKCPSKSVGGRFKESRNLIIV